LPLRLYADECVNGRIVIGLRRRGVDVVTAEDQGLISAGDSDQIARAIALGRTLVTSDRDFFTIADDLMARQTPFPGMFFIQPRATIGEAVRIIGEAAKVLDAPAMESRIEWVP
jgi:hypothetical protein